MSENQQISTGGLGTPVNQGNTPPSVPNAGGNNVSTTGAQSLGQSQNQGEVRSSSSSSLNAAQIQPQDLAQAQTQGQGDLQPPMQSQPSVQVQGGASPQMGTESQPQTQPQAQGSPAEQEPSLGNITDGNLSQEESSVWGATASGEGSVVASGNNQEASLTVSEGTSTVSGGGPSGLGEGDVLGSAKLSSQQPSGGSQTQGLGSQVQISGTQAQPAEATSGDLAGGTLFGSSSVQSLESGQSELSAAQGNEQSPGLGTSQASSETVPVGQSSTSGVENLPAGEPAASGGLQDFSVSQSLTGGEGTASSLQQSSDGMQSEIPPESEESASSSLPPLEPGTEPGAGLVQESQATQPGTQSGSEFLQTSQSSTSVGGGTPEGSQSSSVAQAVKSEDKASSPQAVESTPARQDQAQAGAGDVLAYKKQESEDKQAGKDQSQEPEADKSKEAEFPVEIYSNWQIFFSALVVPFSTFYLVSSNLEAVKSKTANLIFYIGLFLSLVSLGFIVSGLVNSELLYVASGYGGLMVLAVTAAIWFMDQYPQNAKKKSIGAWILTLLLGTATAVLGGVLVSVLYTLLQTYMGNM